MAMMCTSVIGGGGGPAFIHQEPLSHRMHEHCPLCLVAEMLPCSVLPASSTMTVVVLSALFCARPVPQPPPDCIVAVHAPGDRGSVQLKEYESPSGFSPHAAPKPPVHMPGRSLQSCGAGGATADGGSLLLCTAAAPASDSARASARRGAMALEHKRRAGGKGA